MAQRADDDLLYADKQLVIRRIYAPSGLSVSGSIDVFNVDAFAEPLVSSLQGVGDLRVDVHHLEFCDISGIRALVAAARDVDHGCRLVLAGLPQQLQNVMTLVGWDALPGLVISDSDEPGG